MSTQLVATARFLATAGLKRPRQADLKRSISTSYYAVFHAFAKDAADLLVGTAGADRSMEAWRQVYRGLDHGTAKQVCKQLGTLGFCAPLVRAGTAFVDLQEARHDADYDPLYKPTRAAALALSIRADDAIHDLKLAPLKDRRAFAVLLVVRRRG